MENFEVLYFFCTKFASLGCIVRLLKCPIPISVDKTCITRKNDAYYRKPGIIIYVV